MAVMWCLYFCGGCNYKCFYTYGRCRSLSDRGTCKTIVDILLLLATFRLAVFPLKWASIFLWHR